MRYYVMGAAADADAAEAVTDSLRRAGWSVGESYLTLKDLDDLRQRASTASSSDCHLLLLSNRSDSLVDSIVKLDELLSLRRAGTPVVQAVLLEYARAPSAEIARVAVFRGATRSSQVAEALARVEANERAAQVHAAGSAGTSRWSTFSRRMRILRLAVLAVVLIIASALGQLDSGSFVSTTMALALIVALIWWELRREPSKRLSTTGPGNTRRPSESELDAISGAQPPRPPMLLRVGIITAIVLLLGGALLFVVALTDRLAQRVANGYRQPLAPRTDWEYAGSFACLLLGGGLMLFLARRAKSRHGG